MMQWEQLLSLKKTRIPVNDYEKEQDDTRLGFEVDYDRIIFHRNSESTRQNPSYSIV